MADPLSPIDALIGEGNISEWALAGVNSLLRERLKCGRCLLMESEIQAAVGVPLSMPSLALLLRAYRLRGWEVHVSHLSAAKGGEAVYTFSAGGHGKL